MKPRSYLSSHPAETLSRRCGPSRPAGVPLTAPRLYEALDYFLDDDMVLLAEPGDAFCAAPEFHIEEAENFIVQTYYAPSGTARRPRWAWRWRVPTSARWSSPATGPSR